jgi:hypothetical protein
MKAKSKMVSFRLSPDEYTKAEETSRAHGYRSISLFARCAVLAFQSTSAGADAYEQQIRELRDRIDTMAEELVRLSAQLRGSNADEAVSAQ